MAGAARPAHQQHLVLLGHCTLLPPPPIHLPCLPPCRKTRSSLHYDPYNNLLVVAQGTKMVRLVPPSATPLLAPQPIYHDSANHSPADLAAPDPTRFPALAQALPGLVLEFAMQVLHAASLGCCPGGVSCPGAAML